MTGKARFARGGRHQAKPNTRSARTPKKQCERRSRRTPLSPNAPSRSSLKALTPTAPMSVRTATSISVFSMPDLNGTWKVVIHPTAPEPPHDEVMAYMVIRQTFSTVSLRLFTAESHSETLSARVVRCDDGTCNVAAVYRNTPSLRVRERSPLHHGALLLNVQGDPPESLAGQYWTDRLSQGELVLSARSSALAHSFDQATKLTAAEEEGSA